MPQKFENIISLSKLPCPWLIRKIHLHWLYIWNPDCYWRKSCSSSFWVQNVAPEPYKYLNFLSNILLAPYVVSACQTERKSSGSETRELYASQHSKHYKHHTALAPKLWILSLSPWRWLRGAQTDATQAVGLHHTWWTLHLKNSPLLQ